jgi:hypothetical protein
MYIYKRPTAHASSDGVDMCSIHGLGMAGVRSTQQAMFKEWEKPKLNQLCIVFSSVYKT